MRNVYETVKGLIQGMIFWSLTIVALIVVIAVSISFIEFMGSLFAGMSSSVVFGVVIGWCYGRISDRLDKIEEKKN